MIAMPTSEALLRGEKFIQMTDRPNKRKPATKGWELLIPWKDGQQS